MIRKYLIIGLFSFLAACGGSGGDAPREEIDFTAAGSLGMFDPSIANDPDIPGRIWMVYSSVAPSAEWSQNPAISTRLAHSDNAGAAWTDDSIIINQSTDVTLPLPGSASAGTWEHEVPSIIYDPGANPSERWKLLWHHYLVSNNNRLFEHGWIAMKSTATPAGLSTAVEHKLFVASGYDHGANDASTGVPEIQLDALHADLAGCAVFTEPGLYATADALYAVLSGAEPGSPTKGRMILLKLPHSTGIWEYRGTLLINSTDGPAFGYDGFTAGSLYEKGGSVYLIATPYRIVMVDTVETHRYSGTLVFRISGLDSAQIERTAGTPVVHARIAGTAGSHNGAAAYLTSSTGSGIIYSEILDIAGSSHFAIFKSGVNP